MVKAIPEEIIERIRSEADIVDVIGEYVHLQRKGRNYTGLCPFHNEKTSSFTVTPEKQMFYCFGCGVGGDVFKFLMLTESISYPEAISKLAAKLGIVIPEPQEDPRAEQRRRQKQDYLKINRLAADYFHYVLLHSAVADEANRYLAQRQLTEESIAQFQIGFAADSWEALATFLSKKKIPERIMLELGLVSEGKNGHLYDRFRKRIIFPVCDANGEIVAFGGRVLDDSQPKYLNSPETPVFSKSRNLFGLNLAKQAIRQQNSVLVVEGYLDVISLHQYGIKNAVASLGTALTTEQVKLLMRYTHNVILSYDSDAAGVRAALRGLDLLQQQGCRIRVLQISGGKDPDEFLKHYGADAFRQLLTQAKDLVEFKLDVLWQGDNNDVDNKLEVLQQMLPNIALLNSDLLQEEALKKVAAVLSISWEAAAGEFKHFKNSQRRSAGYRSDKMLQNGNNGNNAGKNRNDRFHPRSARARAELGLICLLLADRDCLPQVAAAFDEKVFNDTLFQLIYEYMQTSAKHLQNLAGIFDLCDEELHAEISRLMLTEIDVEQERKLMPEYIKAMQTDNKRIAREQLLKQIAAAEKQQDQSKLLNLLEQLRQIL